MTFIPILKEYWGYNSFRPLQEDIINAVLLGKDTLALLPTGGGKSFVSRCRQWPWMDLSSYQSADCIDERPGGNWKKGITAFSVYSGMTCREVINTYPLQETATVNFYTFLLKVWRPLYLLNTSLLSMSI